MENKITTMDKDTQLPAEVLATVKENAQTYAGVTVWVNQNPKGEEQLFYEYIAATSYEAGSTEYAIKFHQEKKKNDLLEEALEHWNKKATTSIDLLKKIKSRHGRTMMIADPELYNEIKTFLDGK